MSNNISIRDKLVQDFVDNYMEKIFYFCLKKTSNRLDAEDLTQDIALNVIDGLNKGTIPDNYSAWIWQIARNVYSKWAIKKRIKKENINSIDIYDIDIVDDTPNVIDEMIYDEQLALLRRELAFIKSEYRNIIVAYYLENKNIKDIAKSLNLSVDAIHQRLHRARNVLKEGMNMTRTFGKRSYNPELIRYVMNGRCGKKGQPITIISHLLYTNIFLEVYENPQTAEQLSLELGIALPYMEDELAFLCREELLKKEGNAYETNFKIFSKEEQYDNYVKTKKISKQITAKLCEIIDLYVSENEDVLNYHFIGYDNAKWALLPFLYDTIQTVNFFPEYKKNKVSYKDVTRTSRPDDGCWDIYGYEYPVDFELPTLVGKNGYHYTDEKEIIADVNFSHFYFVSKNIDIKKTKDISYMAAYTLWLVCNDKLNECDKRYIDELLSIGYLKKENGEIKPNILILNKYNPLNTSNTKIIELQKEIVELLKKTKFFERGYIIDDAIENGWLKYDENTINTIGAYIYK